MRKLLDGTEVAELAEPVLLVIKTKCPAKWHIIDEQTGQCYMPYEDLDAGKHQWKPCEGHKKVY